MDEIYTEIEAKHLDPKNPHDAFRAHEMEVEGNHNTHVFGKSMELIMEPAGGLYDVHRKLLYHNKDLTLPEALAKWRNGDYRKLHKSVALYEIGKAPRMDTGDKKLYPFRLHTKSKYPMYSSDTIIMDDAVEAEAGRALTTLNDTVSVSRPRNKKSSDPQLKRIDSLHQDMMPALAHRNEIRRTLAQHPAQSRTGSQNTQSGVTDAWSTSSLARPSLNILNFCTLEGSNTVHLFLVAMK